MIVCVSKYLNKIFPNVARISDSCNGYLLIMCMSNEQFVVRPAASVAK